MTIPLPKSADECTELYAAERRVRADWGFADAVDLAWLLNRWQQFVVEVERGFDHRLDEYTYELSLRDEIETIIHAVPKRLGCEIREYVQNFDHRYRFATNVVAKPLLPEVDGPDRQWWSRVPKTLCENLARDLRNEGII